MRLSRSGIAAVLGTLFLLILSACGGGGGGGSTPAGTTNNPYTISGKVTVNGVGLGQVALSIAGAGTEYTQPNGNYTFTHLANGTYTVTPALAGYTFTPATQTVTVADNAALADFTAVAIPTYAISGKVLAASGAGLAGVVVKVTRTATGASAGTQVTDGAGSYSVTGLLNGDYLVSVTHPDGYTFTPASRTVTVADAGASASFDAAVPATYKVAGKVALSSGAGLPNVALVLTSMGGASYSTVTDASGGYVFNGLPDGFYGLVPTLAGYGFTSQPTPRVNGADVTGVDITGMPAAAGGGSLGITF